MKGINTQSISCPILVYNVDGSPNSSLGKQNMILGYTWLKDHNPEVNWQTEEVQMN